MKNKKKLIALVAAGFLTVAAVAGGTLAYFSDRDVANNVITMGKVSVDLSEPSYAGNDNQLNIMPGATIAKDPTVTLDDNSADSYVRMMVEISMANDQKSITDEEKATILGNIDSEKWTLGDDGYYYFNEKLTQSNKVAILFNEVTIPTTFGNDFAEKKLNIDVTAEAIQADNFTPETVNGKITGWNGMTVESYTPAP